MVWQGEVEDGRVANRFPTITGQAQLEMQGEACSLTVECGGLKEIHVRRLLLAWPVGAIAQDRLCFEFLPILSSQEWRRQIVITGVRWKQARPFSADANDNPITIRHRLLDGDSDISQRPGLVNVRIDTSLGRRNLEQGVEEDAGAIRCGSNRHHKKQTQGDALAKREASS